MCVCVCVCVCGVRACVRVHADGRTDRQLEHRDGQGSVEYPRAHWRVGGVADTDAATQCGAGGGDVREGGGAVDADDGVAAIAHVLAVAAA